MAEYAATHDLPQDATLGGPETYPNIERSFEELPKAVSPANSSAEEKSHEMAPLRYSEVIHSK
jgi:hypothetical protein